MKVAKSMDLHNLGRIRYGKRLQLTAPYKTPVHQWINSRVLLIDPCNIQMKISVNMSRKIPIYQMIRWNHRNEEMGFSWKAKEKKKHISSNWKAKDRLNARYIFTELVNKLHKNQTVFSHTKEVAS